MKSIELDASQWSDAKDVYGALLPAIGAPDWHGTSVNALIDSMIYGGINVVEPPFTISVSGLDSANATARDHIKGVFDALAQEGACLENDGNIIRLRIESYGKPWLPDNIDEIRESLREQLRPQKP